MTSPANKEPNDKPKICNRSFKGAYTAKIIDGIACCPGCNLPVQEHKR